MSDISRRIAELSSEKQALLAHRIRSRGAASPVAEPLAIVGMGCRFPAGADSPVGFWRLLRDRIDAVTEVPRERWNADALFDPDPSCPGKMTSRWGTWLERLDEFDAQFFGIAPREAARTDPQQRLLLEVCWEALEDAGQTLEGLAGSRTGIYVGTHVNDYSWITFDDTCRLDAYASTGTSHSIVANRVSYVFDLHGPSIAIDTACSASLVAVHLASQGLRSGECDLAVAGGINLILSPHWSIALSKLGMLSPDGRCRTFDARANGIVRGEGCGMIALKRLSDALAQGDRIWALVRGTATNQDGRTNGLTAPNGLAQQTVVRAALANAGLPPESLSAIEAHGTGTVLGDPIEVEALSEVLGHGDPSENACVVGSAKTNIGHLEGAAGIAGLMKLVLSLQHEELPGLVHFERLNPHISLAGTRFIVSAEPRPWPRGPRRRYAGVSAFGFGGSNAHVILEEAPAEPLQARGIPDDAAQPWLLPLSARTPEALRARAGQVSAFLIGEGKHVPLYDICYTAALRRSRHEHGVAVAGRSRQELADRLEACAGGATPFGAVSVKRDPVRATGLAFIFSGQGSQWAGMGLRLAQADPLVREVLGECDALIRAEAGWSLLEELGRGAPESRLSQTEFAQPAIFALQVGLARWLRGQGVVPDAVAGHSMGEVAAAHVAGLLDLATGVRVIVRRARLMQGATGAGRMVAVDQSADDLADLVEASAGRLSVAAINSPTSCVLSGDIAAVELAVRTLASHGVTLHALPVDYAFHSAQMEPFAAQLAADLAGLRPNAAQVRFVSTVTGQAEVGGVADADYWRRNVREPVRFAAAVETLGRLGCKTFVELGPHPVLVRPLRQCSEAYGIEGTVLATLQREQDNHVALLATVGALGLMGHPVKWEGWLPERGRVVRLPTYPWQREKYPLEKPATAARPMMTVAGADAEHPLLGVRLATAIDAFDVRLASNKPVWLGDHRIHGRVALPAAAFLAMAHAAASRVLSTGEPSVEDLVIEEPLVVPDHGERQVQLACVRESADVVTLRVFSRDPEADASVGWTRHATARVGRGGGDSSAPLHVEAVRAGCPRDLLGAAYYARLDALGASFGSAFRTVEQMYLGSGTTLGRVVAPEGLERFSGERDIHPVFLDAAIQVAGAALHHSAGEDRLYVPVSVRRLRILRHCPERFWVVARIQGGAGDALVNAQAVDDVGQVIFELDGVHLRPASASQVSRTRAREGPLLHTIMWRAQSARAALSTASIAGQWLILADRGGVAKAVRSELEAAGGRAVLVWAGVGTVQDGEGLTVSPHDVEALARIVREAAGAAGTWRGVIHLWGLDSTPPAATSASTLAEDLERGCGGLLALVRALVAQPAIPVTRLWLVTRGACALDRQSGAALAQAPEWGMGQVAALEHPELRCSRIDLDPSPTADLATAIVSELARGDDEGTVALRSGTRYVARLVAAGEPVRAGDTPRRLEKGATAVLDALTWVPLSRRAPRPGEVELRVLSAGLNFRDVLNALGVYPGDPVPLGNECVGRVVRIGEGVTHLCEGDIVMGVAIGSLATHVTTAAVLLVRKPPVLTMVDAATIPIAFLTAHHALIHLARLSRGDRVLIHAAAGGVGLAAVQLALAVGAEVFATAGSPNKRAFLKALGVSHVLDSRSLAFADEIQVLTGGRGVDVVLNSLSGDFIRRSFDVLATGGRFLEIGKRDIWEPAKAVRVRPDAAYWIVYLGEVCEREPARIHAALSHLVDDLAAGRLAPLPVQTFGADEAVEAFRFMAQARHIGKIVLGFEDAAAVAPSIRPDATYLITGGLGGLGLIFAEWLVARGARSLALVGRSAPSAATREAIARLEQAGATVHVASVDVADADALAALLDRIDTSPAPLRGVLHAAGVIDDGPLAQQDWSRCARVLAPKVHGTWNLHRLTANRPLDFFALFSSAASLLGWPGQGSYAAGNAFLDACAGHRRALGLPGLSLNWGAWSGAGMAAALGQPHQERFARWGLRALVPAEGVAAFEAALALPVPQVGVLPVNFAAFAAASGSPSVKLFLSELINPAETSGAPTAARSSERAFPRELADAPPAKRRSLILARVKAQTIRTLGLPASFLLDSRVGLRDVGLDSLMAVELRNALQQLVGQPLPSTLLFDHPTVEALTNFLAGPLLDGIERSAPSPAKRARAAANRNATLDALPDDEAEALLSAELQGLRGPQAKH